jgi:class 3 adenylate cyclase
VTVPVETAETTLATVLFADMRGYTAIAEQLPPARVVPLLDEFFRILGKATEALAAGRANAVSAVTAVCASRTGCFARHLVRAGEGAGRALTRCVLPTTSPSRPFFGHLLYVR